MTSNKNKINQEIVVQIITNEKRIIAEERIINVPRVTKSIVLENKNFCCSVPIVIRKQSKMLLPE